MAKELTRKQVAQLERVLENLQRAEKYIYSDRIAVASRSHGTTTLDYTRADGKALYEVEKAYGSDLTGLHSGIALLKDFIWPKAIEVENERL